MIKLKNIFNNKIILILIFSGFISRYAWISDDAYITFRCVDNFINGYGLRWNIIERAQAYTHPLWALLVSVIYFFTNEFYYSVIFLSLFLSGLSLIFLIYSKQMVSCSNAVLVTFILCFSKAATDYSTSGLENPLSFFLIVIFYNYFFTSYQKKNQILFLSVLAGLSALNRMDTILFYIFPLIYAAYLEYKKNNKPHIILIEIITGFFPLIIWFAFSYIYYGFLFPNTYYAKINTGIKEITLLKQGLHYYLNSFDSDPLTLTAIFSTCFITIFKKEKKSLFCLMGILSYMIYTIKIGGDFMSGRFFTIPLFCSLLLVRRIETNKFFISSLTGIIIVSALFYFRGIYTSALPNAAINSKGIADEREHYFKYTGLINRLYSENGDIFMQYPTIKKALSDNENNLKITVVSAIGFYGFFSDRNRYIVDFYCLANPFLSKLKMDTDARFRIGHYNRTLPEGYLESISSGDNKIKNAELKKIYESIKTITQDDIFSVKRLKEIINF